ncbi:MAG: recombinase family protein [Defluviitaleaceae bacterium]|nr:recombinase family protein [Defluviitaleaceae bacterium]
MIKRAALYIRVSTDDQLEFSPDAQKRALISYAEKNGIEISHTFTEEGKSARTAKKRPEFMRMIGIAKTKPKPFDAILVHKFDRFARNREDSIVYKSMLQRDFGIKVISITESVNDDDKLSVLIEALLEAMAEYYSINLAEEVKKGMTEKARRGGFQTSPALGYYMHNGKLTVHPEEAETVKYIFEQFIDTGQFQIAKKLNSLGIKSKRGKKPDTRGVDYILRNKIYIGFVRWTPEKTGRNFNHPKTIWARGDHEPIISDELFDMAAKKLEGIKDNSDIGDTCDLPHFAKPQKSHWLSGIVKCSACGRTLAFANVKNPSFQCCGYSHAVCAVSHSISARKLEDAVLAELRSVLNDGAFVPKNPDRREEKRKQLRNLNAKLKRVNEAYEAGIDTKDEYRIKKEGIETQRRALMPENPENEKKIANLSELLNSHCDISTKQKAVRSILEKIIYQKSAGRLEFFYRGQRD